MKKRRSPSYARLKAELDRTFSVWTRQRFADRNGAVQCVCCGAVKRWQDQQASHFVSRSYLATRWVAENVAPACFQCNVLKKGNLAAYAAWGVDRYGMDWPARMVKLSRTATKLSKADLQDLIEDYKERIERFGKEQKE